MSVEVGICFSSGCGVGSVTLSNSNRNDVKVGCFAYLADDFATNDDRPRGQQILGDEHVEQEPELGPHCMWMTSAETDSRDKSTSSTCSFAENNPTSADASSM